MTNKTVLFDKQQLLSEINPLAEAVELRFASGTITGYFKEGCVMSVKTQLTHINCHISNVAVLENVLQKFRYQQFYAGVNVKTRSLYFKRESAIIEIYISDFDKSYLESLYSVNIDWFKCSSEVLKGVNSVMSSCSLPDLSCYIPVMRLLHGSGCYLAATNGHVLSRYRLGGELPCDFMLEPSLLKLILPKMKDMNLSGIGSYRHDSVDGVVFDFGNARVFLPKIKSEQLYIEATRGTTIGWIPNTTEEKEIFEGLQKARDSQSVIFCDNLVPFINNHFAIPCQIILSISEGISKQLSQCKWSKMITITLDGNMLRVKSTEINIYTGYVEEKKIKIETLYAANAPVSILIHANPFINAIKGGGLLGLHCNKNNCFVYIKKQQLEQILKGSYNEYKTEKKSKESKIT